MSNHDPEPQCQIIFYVFHTAVRLLEKFINAFELWYWRRLLRVPWNARWSSYSILQKSVLNIHWKGWCWSWSSNTLATWCKRLTHWKRLQCRERLKQKEKGTTGYEMVGWQHPFDGHEFEQTPGDSDEQGSLVCCSPWSHRVRHNLATEQHCSV